MKKLFFDIETLPAGQEDYEKLRLLFGKKLEKKSRKKEMSEEVVVEDYSDKEEAKFEDFVKNTSFDGAFGHVLCVGYAINDGPVEIICNPEDEKKTLEEFWDLVQDVDLFVGHNILSFDLKFLVQRSVVLGVKPSRNINFARYRNNPIFDTMCEWVNWDYKGVGLEHIALALGIPTPKEGIDGSQVHAFFLAGKTKEICDYCKRDVETTRAVYKRMIFES